MPSADARSLTKRSSAKRFSAKRALTTISKPLPSPVRRLRDLRGVGKSIEANLQGLGVMSVEALAQRDGTELYEALCEKTGVRQDPCVLDTFRCAVAQARDPQLPVDQTNWWWWSVERKAGRL